MIFNRSAGVGGDGLTTALMSGGLDRGDAEAEKRQLGVETLLQAAQDGPAVQVAAPGEDWAGALVSEIRRSLAALRGEHRGVRVERLFLTGGGAKTRGLAAYLEGATGLPVQSLDLPGLSTDPQFVEAVGMALGGLGRGVSDIDLIAEEIEREQLLRRKRTQMRLVALAGMAVLVAAVALGISSMQAQRERAQKIQSVQLYVDRADRKLKAAQKAHESVQLQADLLRSALQSQHSWLDLLQDLSDRAPRNVWLTGVDLEKGKPLALRGTAMNGQAVQAFWGNLSHSPYFVKPTLSYANAAKIEEKQVFQFGITSDIVGNKPKPAKPQKKRTRARSTTAATTGATTTSGGAQGENGAGG
jgi:Tfp pilus assembly protein PilN